MTGDLSSEESNGEPCRLDTDESLRLLASRTRRQILLGLLEEEADHVRNLVAGETAPDADIDRRTVDLYHTHLPKLSEAGVIAWDEADDRVKRGDTFEELTPFLERLDQHREELPQDWHPGSQPGESW